jgi:hypothetical protein
LQGECGSSVDVAHLSPRLQRAPQRRKRDRFEWALLLLLPSPQQCQAAASSPGSLRLCSLFVLVASLRVFSTRSDAHQSTRSRTPSFLLLAAATASCLEVSRAVIEPRRSASKRVDASVHTSAAERQRDERTRTQATRGSRNDSETKDSATATRDRFS